MDTGEITTKDWNTLGLEGAVVWGACSVQSEFFYVPVKEEKVEVRKEPVVREEVVIGKKQVEEKQRVEEPLRKEEIHVEEKGQTKARETGRRKDDPRDREIREDRK